MGHRLESTSNPRRSAAWLLAALLLACKTPAPKPDASARAPASAPASAPAPASALASASAPAPPRPIGPYELPFDGARKVYYVIPPRKSDTPSRLIANLHGVCNPPGYACGYWTEAGSNAGFLVCPEGNSRCGGPSGPPTWTEPVPKMDADLERAIAAVDANHPGEISRDGSILTAFSLGAYAAVQIARAHPGRWPYLILNEANVDLDAKALAAAGVKAVALIAGENGSQLAGEKRTAEKLAKQGFPARLWVMKGAGHYYSADIDTIMAEAVAFVLRAPLSEGASAVSADAGAAR